MRREKEKHLDLFKHQNYEKVYCFQRYIVFLSKPSDIIAQDYEAKVREKSSTTFLLNPDKYLHT